MTGSDIRFSYSWNWLPGDPAYVCRPIPTLKENVKNMSAYIIWNPKSKLPPTVTHDTRSAAIRIAGRMAGQNPGETFYVCKLVSSANQAPIVPVPLPKVEYVDLEKADEQCPF